MAWRSARKSAGLLWLSENKEADIKNRGCSMKEFNVTGTCIPEENYMVDMTEKLDQMIRMIEKGQYFTINRARQYGKTTALALLYRRLREKYTIIRLSFEGTGEISFSSDRAFVEMFIRAAAEFGEITGIPEELLGSWKDLSGLLDNPEEDAIDYLSRKITVLCKASSREILLMIDEVDKSSNNQVFLNFLGMLRNKYLRRREGLDVTFKSVILAGVYDIKNLKLKICPDAEKRYNSPWNIAADFNVDMSFSVDEIGGMLKEYEADHNTGMDIGRISRELYFYTGGYPFLVSRLCKWLDEEGGRVWTTDNIKNAETALLKTRNTLFDDLIKNVENNEELKSLLMGILYDGNKYSFNLSNPVINLGVMFGILAEQDHMTVISNIIFETYLYDYFVSIKSMEKSFPVSGRDQFIREGKLDMPRILKKFQEVMKEEYRKEDEKFLEQQGRLLFLCFLKPIINGVGFYYVEPETRNNTRMDIVVAYGGEEHIIELKIWRGAQYRTEGIRQLEAYMDNRRTDVGYLVSFSFLKEKKYLSGWVLESETEKHIFEVTV